MNLRELLDTLSDITRASNLPVLSEEGLELTNVEYNDDDEPCVLLIFEEPGDMLLTLADITKREP